MKKCALLVVLITLLCCGIASAEPYVSANLGVVFTNDSDIDDADLAAMGVYNAELSYDTGFVGSIAVGNSFDAVRVEGEFAYRQADLSELTFEDAFAYYQADLNGDYTSMTLMANVYYDFMKDKVVSPFIGCGLGMNMIEVDLGTIGGVSMGSEDDTVFAYQLAAGASFKATEKINIDLTYKYLSGADPDFDGSSVDYSSNNLTAGVRVQF